MSYIIKIGTTEAAWNHDKPVPDGYVRFDGDLPARPIWDAVLSNIREKTRAELDADQAVKDARDADNADLRSRVATAISRLDDIATNGGSYTNAQVRTAVVDMAQIMHALIREIRHTL